MHAQYCDAWARTTESKMRIHASQPGRETYRKSGAVNEGTGTNNGPMKTVRAQTKAPTDNTLKSQDALLPTVCQRSPDTMHGKKTTRYELLAQWPIMAQGNSISRSICIPIDLIESCANNHNAREKHGTQVLLLGR